MFVPANHFLYHWKEAGYIEEMTEIERAIAEDRRDDVPKYLTDRWLADVSLFGPATQVREGIAAWQAAGVNTPVIVPSSTARRSASKALEEIFATFG